MVVKRRKSSSSTSSLTHIRSVSGRGQIRTRRSQDKDISSDTEGSIHSFSADLDEPSQKQPESKKTSSFNDFFTTKKFIFAIGIILGLVCAGYVGSKKAMDNGIFFPDSEDYKKIFASQYWEDWKSVLPQGLKSLMEETENEKYPDTSASFAIGKLVKKRGYEAKHNVIIIPGTTSSGIESWGLDGVEGCPSESYFRKRLWGSFFMVKTMVLDKECWLKHIMLDPKTGLDPPGVKLRAAQGFEASDFFITGYWIWNKVLQNLAVIGYGPDNMISASYDWRLAFMDLELRDGYFSRLKESIETMKLVNGQKTVMFGHSMGAQVIFYFLKWVEASGKNFGNGGKHWVNDHIEAFVDISGCLLGTPKAVVALLSGEIKETMEMRGLAMHALETFFSRGERAKMVRSWGGITSMLPKGGDMIWGTLDQAPDDLLLPSGQEVSGSLGNFLRFTKKDSEYSRNMTIDGSIDFLMNQTSEDFRRQTNEHYSHGYAHSKQELRANEKKPNKWVNPLEVPLPNAPDMQIYCFYGVGNPTERAYYYKEEKDKLVSRLNITADTSLDNSVLSGEGDGTVSIMTHYMCHKWAQKGRNPFNPGNSNVTIVEIKHEPERFDIRGGAKTAEHVDILGSSELNELLLTVASGHGWEIQNNYITHLREMAEKLNPFTYKEGAKVEWEY